MSRFIRREAGRLPMGSTMLVISAQPGEDLLAAMLDMKRKGRSTVLVKVGGQPPGVIADNLATYHVSDDVPWEVLEAINIKENTTMESA